MSTPFETRFRVRYAEIDGQRVVFNSRYLEYADVVLTEYWDWTGIADALGDAWREAEFHVRRAEVDYLRPFVWGDVIRGTCRIERVGSTSLTKVVDLRHAETDALHATVTMVSVNVHLPTGRPLPFSGDVRAYLERLYSAASARSSPISLGSAQ